MQNEELSLNSASKIQFPQELSIGQPPRTLMQESLITKIQKATRYEVAFCLILHSKDNGRIYCHASAVPQLTTFCSVLAVRCGSLPVAMPTYRPSRLCAWLIVTTT